MCKYNLAQAITRQNFYPDLAKTDSLPLATLIICGAASGSFASFILTPVELIKCKMQVQSVSTVPAGLRTGSLALIRDVYGAHGLRGFWNGQTGTFLRETGGSASWFGAYEYVSAALRRRKNTDTLSPTDMMLSGAAGEIISWKLLFARSDDLQRV